MSHGSSGKLVSIIAKAVPYAGFGGAAAVVIIGFMLGRSDLVIRSLYLLAPISAVMIIAIIKPDWIKNDFTDSSPRIKLSASIFQYLGLLFILIYIISICLLIGNEVRPLIYFILVGVMAALIFVEILSCGEEHSGRKGIILFQIVLVSANLIFGLTLRLPFYFGFGDVLTHMNYIDSIVKTGQVSDALGNYQYFPNFHIFNASGTLLSGMSLQTSYYIFNGLFFLVSIPIIYLLVSQLIKNVHLPLMATLVYSLSREVIFNGMYMITRVMAFIFCLLILYILIRSRGNLKLRTISLFLVIPLVMVHQTTLLHFSGILLALALIETCMYRNSWSIGMNFLLFFVIAYLGYWFWQSYPFIAESISNLIIAPDFTRSLPTASEVPLFVTFTSNADLIVLVILVMIGIISLLYAHKQLVAIGTVFAVFTLAASIIYFPGFNNILAHILLTYRVALLVTPFIAFTTAAGLLLLIRRTSTDGEHMRSTLKIGISVCVIFVMTVLSTVILGNFNDLNYGKVFGNTNRQYFTESEIAAFSFSYQHGRDIAYYGDDASLKYMIDYLGMSQGEPFDSLKPESIRTGYMLFRKEELESRGQLSFITYDPVYQEYLYKGTDLQAKWEQENKIFDNGSVYLYLKKTPD